MDNLLVLFIITLLSLWMPGIGRAAGPATTSVPVKSPAVTRGNGSTMPPSSMAKSSAVEDPAKSAPAYQLYSYYGDRYRDPFIALTGEFRQDQGADRPPQISTLSLKGILQDEKGRVALLTSGVNSYVLRGGRLYDGRNHLMKGISGIVKSNSVILMGSDHTIRELHVTATL
jgi:hypothetical protein